MKIRRDQAEKLSELMDQAYCEIEKELSNSRECKNTLIGIDLMEINKTVLVSYIDTLQGLLKQVKSLKEFNPNRTDM